jgi:hypothetical protein
VAEETKSERLNRELIEVLNELRVALPGVQVLFAFLLAVPFTQRWGRTTDLQRDVFFAAILATTLSSILLIAPSAYHRILFRERDKEHIIHVVNRLTLSGLALLAVAMACAVFLVTDMLYTTTWATVVTAAVVALFAWFWFAMPAIRKATKRRE